MKKIIVFILILISIAILVCTPILFLNKKPTKAENSTIILELWHIDTFEGGTGSRANFLNSVAKTFEKKYKNVYVYVTTHTQNSAKELMKKNVYPDAISYGVCGLDIFDRLTPLKEYNTKDAGVENNKRYAVCWAKGGYGLFSKGSSENTFIENYSFNSLYLPALFSKENYNLKETDNNVKFASFVSCSNVQMIGSQRDLVRLDKRNIEYNVKAINGYNDLFQYISITSNDLKKVNFLHSFIDILMSDETQYKLKNLCLFSAKLKNIYKNDERLGVLEDGIATYTISPFILESDLYRLFKMAKDEYLGGKDKMQLIKLLKQL